MKVIISFLSYESNEKCIQACLEGIFSLLTFSKKLYQNGSEFLFKTIKPLLELLPNSDLKYFNSRSKNYLAKINNIILEQNFQKEDNIEKNAEKENDEKDENLDHSMDEEYE